MPVGAASMRRRCDLEVSDTRKSMRDACRLAGLKRPEQAPTVLVQRVGLAQLKLVLAAQPNTTLLVTPPGRAYLITPQQPQLGYRTIPSATLYYHNLSSLMCQTQCSQGSRPKCIWTPTPSGTSTQDAYTPWSVHMQCSENRTASFLY